MNLGKLPSQDFPAIPGDLLVCLELAEIDVKASA